ncbi:hypothetical protein MIND_01335800 [Mycena indigotica]|uniref:YTH domain-containing protein n=1 Tax=Mycena indigotica TaxID=2126181 RepID=A0A8H6VU63_9AGAR|nr:uncharacterized protein MIND_01335800 [Mycena indigotica]KAF7290223.1 hypothetical protein MIND_01335800 [Mycena indigotica]
MHILPPLRRGGSDPRSSPERHVRHVTALSIDSAYVNFFLLFFFLLPRASPAGALLHARVVRSLLLECPPCCRLGPPLLYAALPDERPRHAFGHRGEDWDRDWDWDWDWDGRAMAGYGPGRGQERGSGSRRGQRRQGQQQQQQSQSLPPPQQHRSQEQQPQYSPHYAPYQQVAYGQYMMSPASHYFAPPPQPQQQQQQQAGPSIHAGYPTLAAYAPQQQPSYDYDYDNSPTSYQPPSFDNSPTSYQPPSFPYPPYHYGPPPTLYPQPMYYTQSGHPESEGSGWWGGHGQQQQSYDPGYSYYPQPPRDYAIPTHEAAPSSSSYRATPDDHDPTPEPPTASTSQKQGKTPSPTPPRPRPVATRASSSASVASAALLSPSQRSDKGKEKAKPIVRRAYHPNPPASRSEWVMWAGNVPSDAGHDELWRFFTAPASVTTPPASEGGSVGSGSTAGPAPALTTTTTEGQASSASPTTTTAPADPTGDPGVLSIFLIARSNCAFVNYATAAHLHAAIARFHGVPLRADDPRCPRLVCRVRRKDDDLKAGVGGQRGMGMHTRWVKAKRAKGGEAEGTPSSDSGHALDQPVSSEGEADAEDSHDDVDHVHAIDEVPVVRPPPRPSGSGSPGSGSGSHESASTDSTLLREHFPQRYFILKSLTKDDLELSVKTGLWATQHHNEGVLDRAFRTSQDVFLVFSVNKSGEFYGYARMAGPISETHDPLTSSSPSVSVAWSQRSPPSPVPPAPSSPAAPLFSGGRFVGDSPLPMSSARAPIVQSAPAILGPNEQQRAFSAASPALKFSLDHHLLVSAPTRAAVINLDANAPLRAMRNSPTSPVAPVPSAPALGPAPPLAPVERATTHSLPVPLADPSPDPDADAGWGANFALTWVCTDRLPFTRTRNIRNPWNHDREVKVSRDGTELEPGVGKALLDAWRAYLEAQSDASASASASASTSASPSTSGRGQPRPGAARQGSSGGSGRQPRGTRS